jgi:hypothetical protein
MRNKIMFCKVQRDENRVEYIQRLSTDGDIAKHVKERKFGKKNGRTNMKLRKGIG